MFSSLLKRSIRFSNGCRILYRSFSNDISNGNNSSGPTAIVMLNMGGPATQDEVQPFLTRLFGDGEIIELGRLQSILGPYLAKKRTPRIANQYKQIGGSPIRKWTNIQGEAMTKRLNEQDKNNNKYKHYIMFRYADPLTEETLLQMKSDGVKRAIAFSQYPQFSCTTTGSSLNHLWRELTRLNLQNEFQWSIIDRWFNNKLFISAVVNRILMAFKQFPTEQDRENTILLFSAHSLPMRIVNRGDPYVAEVAATVNSVIQLLKQQYNINNTHILAWQSQVGFLPWMTPQTGEVIKGLGNQGHKNLLVIPIAFTSDHIETLFELDIEYSHIAKKAGIINYIRSPSLNDEPLLADAFTQIIQQHIDKKEVCSSEYQLNCSGCFKPLCRSIINPIQPYTKLRDKVNPNGDLAKHIANTNINTNNSQ